MASFSVREICQQLKASRSWVNRYVLPHLDKVYLNSNIRSDEKTKAKINWVQVASAQLGRGYIQDSIWCKTEQYKTQHSPAL